MGPAASTSVLARLPVTSLSDNEHVHHALDCSGKMLFALSLSVRNNHNQGEDLHSGSVGFKIVFGPVD